MPFPARPLKIALAQPSITQGDPEANVRKAERFAAEAAGQGAQLLCLPELFNTGYFLSPSRFIELAEPVDGPYIQTLRRLARKYSLSIVSGYAESCEIAGRIYNSAAFIGAGGELVGNMRKVNLWGEEKLRFRAGDAFPVFDTPLGRIGMLICYDVESPEPSRILGLKGAELVLVPAMWDIPAHGRWDLALAANALFNLYFVAGCNPVDHTGCGASQVVAPGGVVVARASSDREELLVCDIDLGEVRRTRGELPYYNDLRPDIFPREIVERY